MSTMDRYFLAFHVLGALMWIGSTFAVMSFLEAVHGEPDASARGRLIKFLRQAAIVPDVGATIAIVFGAHWLFRFKLYQAPYMHAKLACVLGVIALHVWLRIKVRHARKGEPFTPPPPALKGVLSVLATAILIFVIVKPF